MSIKSKNLTAFGVYAQKLRVDHNEYSKDMAAKLSITPTYLSAAEHGRRNTPHRWIKLLSKAYSLTDVEILELTRSVSESRIYDRLNISHLSFDDKRMMSQLALMLPNMDPETKSELNFLIAGV